MFTVPGLVSGIWLRALQPAAAQSTHSINYCYYHYYYFLCDDHNPTARMLRNDSLPEAIYV